MELLADMTEATTPCAGCGKPAPVRVGEQDGDGSRGEWLSTPIGDCFHRTHWDDECVSRSQQKVDGRPIQERVDKAQEALL